MSGYKFSAAVRYAVYTVHGSHCYMCGKPIYLHTMRVDHVLPRSLMDTPERLAAILRDYGLPPDFNLESFENWLPACEPCNVGKGDRVFRPTAIVQVHIDRARSNAAKAEAAAKRIVTNQSISKALNTLERALDARQVDHGILEPLIRDYRHAANQDEIHEFRISPNHTVIYEGETYRIIRTNYGVGYMPSQGAVDISFQCPQCGNFGPWSGARCVSCGHLIDD
ncbi:hypothetical protein [Bradyrhizobium barranii]